MKERYRASKLPQACFCGETRVDLHHKTYKRIGAEHLTDLAPLCRKHHDEAHERARSATNRSKRNLWSTPTQLAKIEKKKAQRVKREAQRARRRARQAKTPDLTPPDTD